ncbi:MAG: DUF6600 domain-containing protein [Acidiphilium sp.]
MRRTIRSGLGLGTAILLCMPAMRPAQAQNEAAPPGRVGQIARIDGNVSFDQSGQNDWTQAALNYPVTGGDALYTQPGAQASVAIDWSTITLNGASELTVTRIGPHTVEAALPQGEAWLDLRRLGPGDRYVVTTPRGNVTIARSGRYDILAGDQNSPTTVTVIDGAAQMQGQDVSLDIGPGETATLSGTNPIAASLGAVERDPFATRMLAVRYAAPPSYVPPVVEQMTGGYQLAQYGTWSQSPQYGAVWYPRVASGWVPYRDGHWAYVAPWGWTWVDNDPWGFAPFHYGRWVQYGGRWGWAPAPVTYSAPAYYQPVYAPATVSFFSVGSGVAIGVGITAAALAAGSIGWVPLAPHEPYLPWYHCPPHYIRQINYYNVRNVNRFTTINNTTIINRYGPQRLANRGGATVVPADVMRRGDPVGRFAHPAPHTLLASARPVPPAGFRAGPQPGGHRGPGFGHLPGAPGNFAHRIAAPAPRPAPFATARGLPVGHPGPIHGAALHPMIRMAPHGAPNGAAGAHGFAPPPARGAVPQGHFAPHQPAHPSAPNGGFHPLAAPRPPAAAHPGTARPAAPGFHPQPFHAQPAHPQRAQLRNGAARPAQINRPTQQFHPQAARPAQHPPQFHAPAPRFRQPAPQVHRAAPQFHRPAPQPQRPAPQFHPPARPQFHPQPHPQARPQFHPPARPAPRPQPRPAPAKQDQHP